MDFIDYLLEALKYILPSIVVMITAVLILRSFTENSLKMKQVDMLLKKKNEVLPIRIQAYERLTLLLERIQPATILSRLRRDNMTAPELQLSMVNAIRSEFEHNYSQQIYVSDSAWSLVRSVVEQNISVINRVGSQLPSEASGSDFGRSLIKFIIEDQQEVSSAAAISFLKKEVQQLF